MRTRHGQGGLPLSVKNVLISLVEKEKNVK